VPAPRPQPTSELPAATPVEGANVLLALGTALLVVAAIVFVAVVWTRIGALGQATVLTSLALGLGTLAVRLRRRLSATAEALAVLSLGLLAIELLAAPHLGLVRIEEAGWGSWWPVLAWTVVGVTGVGSGWAYGLRAWTALGWLAAIPATGSLALAVTRHLDWSDPGRTSGLGAATAIASALLLLSVPTRQPSARISGFIVAAGVVAVAPMSVTADGARPGWLFAGLVAMTGLVVRRDALVKDSSSRSVWELTLAVTAGLTASLAVLPPDATQLGWALAAALLGAAAVTVSVQVDRVLPGYVAATSLWLSWVVGRAVQDLPATDGTLAWQVVIVLVTASAVLLVDAYLGRRPEFAWVGAGVGIAATALGMAHLQAGAVEAYSLPSALLLLAAGQVWRAQRPAPSLAWCGPAAAMALVPSALATWTGWTSPESTSHLIRLAAVLLAAGVMIVVGLRLRWSGLWAPGVTAFALSALAGITEVAQRVGVLEVFTLPTAALLLAGGLLVRRLAPCGSLVWCGPAAAMALIPSALLTWTAPWTLIDFADQPDEARAQVLRLVYVLVGGGVLVVVGARVNWGGLLVPAAAALTIAATGQVWATAQVLPRWMVLAAIGTSLVVAGARMEWLREQRARMEDWAGRLA
jgi:hypothetical protein